MTQSECEYFPEKSLLFNADRRSEFLSILYAYSLCCLLLSTGTPSAKCDMFVDQSLVTCRCIEAISRQELDEALHLPFLIYDKYYTTIDYGSFQIGRYIPDFPSIAPFYARVTLNFRQCNCVQFPWQ